ncbi:MAG: bifunctional 3,4-dihydroxy-2-butanone-4-phosphate synthase/GTP cyclohydrolase II [Burkholderiaceae bacterium]
MAWETVVPNTARHPQLHPAEEIIEEIRAGRMVVLVDDEDRENEGDLVMAADAVTPEAINFMARYGRGLICLTLTQDKCRQLKLPLMVLDNRAAHTTAFTVSIEAATGVTTGISAADRARTIATAVADDARPEDLVQPGHIFPLMAQPGGVLARAGHTEAGCDLPALAGRRPAGVICEILNDDGSMARLPDLIQFAQTHGLKLGSIADLIHHRTAHESLVTRVSEQVLTGPYEGWTCLGYQDKAVGQAHLALRLGTPDPLQETLVRVHEPLTVLDLLGFDQAVHSWPVAKAVDTIEQRGCGVLVFLNCGTSPQVLFDQMAGRKTSAALPAQNSANAASSMALRNYGMGAAILKDLGVGKMKLLAQPRKMPSMMGFGLEVTGYLQP